MSNKPSLYCILFSSEQKVAELEKNLYIILKYVDMTFFSEQTLYYTYLNPCLLYKNIPESDDFFCDVIKASLLTSYKKKKWREKEKN